MNRLLPLITNVQSNTLTQESILAWIENSGRGGTHQSEERRTEHQVEIDLLLVVLRRIVDVSTILMNRNRGGRD